MDLFLTNEDKNILMIIIRQSYLADIFKSIQEKQQDEEKIEFEDILDGSKNLADFYNTLIGLETIKGSISKKELIREEIRQFIQTILRGIEIANKGQLGQYKENVKSILGEDASLAIYKQLMNSHRFPTYDVPSLADSECAKIIRTMDFFIHLNPNEFKQYDVIVNAITYFQRSVAKTIDEYAQKRSVKSSIPVVNNNNNNSNKNNNSSYYSSFPQTQFKSSTNFPSEGILDINESHLFRSAVRDHNVISSNALFVTLVLKENDNAIALIQNELSLKNNVSQLLNYRDRFGNNAIHLACMFATKDTLNIVQAIHQVINHLDLFMALNHYQIRPAHLLYMYDGEKQCPGLLKYFINHGYLALDEEVPLTANSQPRRP